jgi:hypothetical protein
MMSSATKTSATKTIVGSFVVLSAIVLLLNLPGLADQGSSVPRPAAKLYNTAKPKLLDGKQIYSDTITKPDTDLYCQVAAHYDFVWLEMQHSTLTWADLEKMIAACPGVGVPMVRLPDAPSSMLPTSYARKPERNPRTIAMVIFIKHLSSRCPQLVD